MGEIVTSMYLGLDDSINLPRWLVVSLPDAICLSSKLKSSTLDLGLKVTDSGSRMTASEASSVILILLE